MSRCISCVYFDSLCLARAPRVKSHVRHFWAHVGFDWLIRDVTWRPRPLELEISQRQLAPNGTLFGALGL